MGIGFVAGGGKGGHAGGIKGPLYARNRVAVEKGFVLQASTSDTRC